MKSKREGRKRAKRGRKRGKRNDSSKVKRNHKLIKKTYSRQKRFSGSKHKTATNRMFDNFSDDFNGEYGWVILVWYIDVLLWLLNQMPTLSW